MAGKQADIPGRLGRQARRRVWTTGSGHRGLDPARCVVCRDERFHAFHAQT